VFGSNVRIVDENNEEVPRGVIGRISYKSGGTATSFHNDPEASKTAFRNGWYFPGDLGYVSERGFVFITGREKDLIIRAGVNIYPNEIESVLLAHPQIDEAARHRRSIGRVWGGSPGVRGFGERIKSERTSRPLYQSSRILQNTEAFQVHNGCPSHERRQNR
jgi:AMP-binding enzyme